MTQKFIKGSSTVLIFVGVSAFVYHSIAASPLSAFAITCFLLPAFMSYHFTAVGLNGKDLPPSFSGTDTGM